MAFMFRHKQNNSSNVKTRPAEESLARFFREREPLHAWLILLVLCLLLAWMVTPPASPAIPDYAVGSIATKDIKADRDFLVEDRVATEQKKNEAAREAPPVYEYAGEPTEEIALIRDAFYRAKTMLRDREVMGEAELMPLAIEAAREALVTGEPVTLDDTTWTLFYDLGFPSTVPEGAAALLQALYRDRHVVNESAVAADIEYLSIILDDTSFADNQVTIDRAAVTTMEEARTFLTGTAPSILEDHDPASREVSLVLAERLLRPSLHYSKIETERRRRQLADEVKPVFYRVQQHEMIVREGQIVTAADRDKLLAISEQYGDRFFSRVSLLVGTFLFLLILALILSRIAFRHLNTLQGTTKNLLLLAAIAVLQVVLVKAGIVIADEMSLPFPDIHNPIFFAIPFAAGSMLVSVVTGSRDIGLIFSVFVSFLAAVLFYDTAAFFLYSFSGSAAASYLIVHCRKRSDFLITGLRVGAVNLFVVLAIAVFSGTVLDPGTAVQLVMALAGGLIAGVIASGTAPLIEYLFGYTTDIKLLEMGNLNQPIFQDMIMKAPGTYHHSIIVASMVEAAADEIGANALLAKVGACYHDIGKMKKPLYYIENQQRWENRHEKLKPTMSSRVIISHVKDGCDMAAELGLGDELCDIIRQHHGTRLAAFFYEKAKKEQEPSKPPILESDFRYPGPKPRSKEAALVLLADAVEASSRILENPTPSRIKTLIQTRIREAVDDRQLDESNLTFSDLDRIAETFARILNGIFHHRIEYSESDGKDVYNGQKNESARKKQAGKGVRRS